MHDSILLPFIYKPHGNYFLHPANDQSTDTDAESDDPCIDPEQCPVPTQKCDTPHIDNCLANKPGRKEYFDIFNEEIVVR